MLFPIASYTINKLKSAFWEIVTCHAVARWERAMMRQKRAGAEVRRQYPGTWKMWVK